MTAPALFGDETISIHPASGRLLTPWDGREVFG
jgi:hypothetical protein